MKFIVEGRELEVSDDAITKALEEKTDVTIEAKDLVIRTKQEDETFTQNVVSNAKTTGVEMAIKEVKATLGLEFQGKTMDNLVDAVKAKAIEEAKIEPNKQVENLRKDLDTLKGTLQTVTTEKENIEGQFKSYKAESVINNTLLAAIPEGSALPKDDMMIILKNKMKFSLDESNRVVVVGADGNVMKDSILNPLDPKTVVTSFFNDNPVYLNGAKGGAGGDDTPGGGTKMTVDQFIEKKAKEGISHTSTEFNTELQELIKKGEIQM